MKQTQPVTTPSVGIYYTHPAQKKRVKELSRLLALPLTTDTSGYDFILTFSNDKLHLSMVGDSLHRSSIYTEFVGGAAGYRRKHTGKEMLRKAIGFRAGHPPIVLDATGGMGKDAFLMAGYGSNVHVIERNPIIAALLEDGLRRAAENPDTQSITARIHLSVQNSLDFLLNLNGVGKKEEKERENKKYEVVYLDPMFPERSKSALVKKEMQILQKLLGLENDTEKLFKAALAAAGKRVVVKRPKAAPSLPGPRPSHSISGKTTRFDVYMTTGLNLSYNSAALPKAASMVAFCSSPNLMGT